MKVIIDEGAYVPERAHSTDAGLDLRSPIDVEISPGGSAVIDTGVHVEIPDGCAGELISKSGLNVKHSLISTGLIDHGYTGSIVVKLYNFGSKAYQVHKGDKVSQLVVYPVRFDAVERVDSFEKETERGNAGFGSTGV